MGELDRELGIWTVDWDWLIGFEFWDWNLALEIWMVDY